MARKVKTSKQVIDRLFLEGESPAEVMVKNMRRFNKAAEDLLDQAEMCHNDEKRATLMKMATECMQEASEIAKNVAPYFHPKLQSTTISGDDERPPVQYELRGVDELRKLVRGQSANVVPLTSVKK